MMPTPTQFVFAFICAYLLRVHLPVSLFSTLYTNPLTLVPLTSSLMKLAIWLLHGSENHADLIMPQFGNEQFWHDFWPLEPPPSFRYFRDGRNFCRFLTDQHFRDRFCSGHCRKSTGYFAEPLVIFNWRAT